MKRTTRFSVSALMLGTLLLLGGCRYDSASYHYDQYDAGPDGYHSGYVNTETPKRPRVQRHYTTGYNVGYRSGYHTGGSYISIGHTTHYSHGGYHAGYRHTGYHGGYHNTHRSHYGHRGHGGGYIHFGGHHGGYHCD